MTNETPKKPTSPHNTPRKPNKEGEHWIQKYWRPAMSIQYFIICMFDFMLAPIGSAIYSAVRGIDYIAWHPLTLEGGGLYHIAIGAILGVSAWTRGQEKIAIVNAEKSGE